MYLLYCLALLLAVYLAPALAVRPQLLLEARTAVAIPFVSVAVVLLGQWLLAAAGHYERAWVLGLSGLFSAVALVRVTRLLGASPTFRWPPTHRYLVLFAALLGVYWAADLGSTGFDTNDEIYSWNLWALQHARGEAIDFYYTRAPYPQGFAIFLSWGYLLLGDSELQLPLRAPLALFPVALWAAIAIAPREATFAHALRGVLLMLLLVAAIGRYFNDGLADPLMAGSLVLSVFLFAEYRRRPGRPDLLVLSVACAAVALFTKQAALIWALVSFPLIVGLAVAGRRLPPVSLLAAAATVGLALAWILGPGQGFAGNQGVIDASREGRGVAEQLLYAIGRHASDQPLVPLLMVAALVAVTRARCQRDIAWLFLFPATLVWLLYGAYSLRLGIHLVALAGLLLALTGYALPGPLGGGSWTAAERVFRRRPVLPTVLLAVLIAGVAGKRVMDNVNEVGDGFSFYRAGANTLGKYFGADAERVIAETYDRRDRLLWVPSNYLYGIYYGHTPMVRPGPLDPDAYTVHTLLEEIDRQRPDYLFDAGDRVAFGPGSQRLRELARDRCPDLFETVAAPPNKYGYTLHRWRGDAAGLERCRRRLGDSAPG